MAVTRPLVLNTSSETGERGRSARVEARLLFDKDVTYIELLQLLDQLHVQFDQLLYEHYAWAGRTVLPLPSQRRQLQDRQPAYT